MNIHCGGAVVVVALVASGTAVSACGTGKVVFSDSFDTLNQTTWGAVDDHMRVANGAMTIDEQDGKFYALYAEPVFRGVDYCANVTLNDSSDIPSSYGGVSFWMRSPNDFYAFEITLDGYATVYRYNGTWTSLIDDRAFAAIKQGVGAVNELRVVTKGPNATFYVNDQKFDVISDKTVPGSSQVGMVVEAPKNGHAAFAFDDTVVHEVATN